MSRIFNRPDCILRFQVGVVLWRDRNKPEKRKIGIDEDDLPHGPWLEDGPTIFDIHETTKRILVWYIQNNIIRRYVKMMVTGFSYFYEEDEDDGLLEHDHIPDHHPDGHE